MTDYVSTSGRTATDVRRAVLTRLTPDDATALARAASAVRALTELDGYWQDQIADLRATSDRDARSRRARGLTLLGPELTSNLEILAGLRGPLVQASRTFTELMVIGNDWPPPSVPPTDPIIDVIGGLPPPVRSTVVEVGQGVVRGLTDPGFPDAVDQALAAVAQQTGIPQSVIDTGIALLDGGQAPDASSVVGAIVDGAAAAGVPLPQGFADAGQALAALGSGSGSGGGPDVSGLVLGVMALAGVPGIVVSVVGCILWIARYLAQEERQPVGGSPVE